MGIQSEGSITFWLRHEHEDWTTNSESYHFATVKRPGVAVKAIKHPDKTIELELSGPLGQHFDFRHLIPECEARGLFVAITWKAPELNLYLNGKLVEAVSLSQLDNGA